MSTKFEQTAPHDPSRPTAKNAAQEAWLAALVTLKNVLPLYQKHLKTLVVTAALALVPVALVSTIVSEGTNYWGARSVASARAASAQLQKEAPDLKEALGLGSAATRAWSKKLTPKKVAKRYAPAATSLGLMFGGIFLTTFILLPLSLVAHVLSSAALCVQSDRLLNGSQANPPKEAWTQLKGRMWPLISTSALLALLVAVGTALFVLPGVFIAWRCLLATQVVVFEGKANLQALRRSSQLVSGGGNELGLVFGLYLGATFLAGMVLVSPLPASLETLCEAGVSAALLPFLTLGLTQFYRQLSAQGPLVEPQAIGSKPV